MNDQNSVSVFASSADNGTFSIDTLTEQQREFSSQFLRTLDEGVKIAMGGMRGRPARELIEEMKAYVEKERADG